MPSKPNGRPTAAALSAERGKAIRARILAYLTECITAGTDPGGQNAIADRLGLCKWTVGKHLNAMRREGVINYTHGAANWTETLVVIGATPTVAGTERRCVHCGILCRHLDRAGYCPICQVETAFGEVYTYWNTHGVRIRIEGMAGPQEPSLKEGGIAAPDWPTRGVLQEVRL
jgi:DNA-binding MarR family transcriptional regulator